MLATEVDPVFHLIEIRYDDAVGSIDGILDAFARAGYVADVVSPDPGAGAYILPGQPGPAD